MGYSRKNPNRGRGGGGSCGYTFLKKTLESFIFLLYPWKFHTKQSSTPGYSTKLCQIPWNFQGQKQIPLEIPHYFFLVTLGNSTSFLINPWKFHMLFLGYHWEFHILNSPPPLGLDFLWNSPILKKCLLLLFFVSILSSDLFIFLYAPFLFSLLLPFLFFSVFLFDLFLLFCFSCSFSFCFTLCSLFYFLLFFLFSRRTGREQKKRKDRNTSKRKQKGQKENALNKNRTKTRIRKNRTKESGSRKDM